MIRYAPYLLHVAHALWMFALIAGWAGAAGLLLASVLRARGRSPSGRISRKSLWRTAHPRPSQVRQPGAALGAALQVPTMRATTASRGAAAITTIPAIASRAPNVADSRAVECGLGGLVACARASRWRNAATEAAALQIDAPDERLVAVHLEVARRLLPMTIFSTTGVFAVFVHDGEPNDADTLVTLGRRLDAGHTAISELGRLSGVQPQVVAYLPYLTAAARPGFIAGHSIVTVGGPHALARLLAGSGGHGLSVDALDRLRQSADLSIGRADAGLGSQSEALGALAAAVTASRRRRNAQQIAAEQISPLASTQCVVEFDLELANHPLPVTIFTTTGMFVGYVGDFEGGDRGTIDPIRRDVEAGAIARSELARLTGLAPQVIVYSPHAHRTGHPAHVDSHLVLSGPRAFAEFLDQHTGQGLTAEELKLFRAAAKPYGRAARSELAYAIGHDSPDLAR